MIEGCSIRGEKKSGSLFSFFFFFQQRRTRHEAKRCAIACMCDDSLSSPVHTTVRRAAFFSTDPRPPPSSPRFHRRASSSTSVFFFFLPSSRLGWLSKSRLARCSPIFPWVSFSPRMCAAVITILGRGRGGRGGRLEAKAHAFRRGICGKMKRRGEKKRKIRVTKRTWNFAFVQLAISIRWNYGKKKIKKGDKKRKESEHDIRWRLVRRKFV